MPLVRIPGDEIDSKSGAKKSIIKRGRRPLGIVLVLDSLPLSMTRSGTALMREAG
jgi:hypothetical protein